MVEEDFKVLAYFGIDSKLIPIFGCSEEKNSDHKRLKIMMMMMMSGGVAALDLVGIANMVE